MCQSRTNDTRACVASIISLIFRVRAFGTNDLTVEVIPTMATNMVELTVGLIITCFASVAKLGRHIKKKHDPTKTPGYSNDSDGRGYGMHLAKRKHAPGGLSELDSMKTFGTTVDVEYTRDSSSMKDLTANASPYGTGF